MTTDEDDGERPCGCSNDNGPCDAHNGSDGEAAAGRQHELDQELRDSGRGHLVRG